jgi:cytochrome P450
MTVTRKPLRSPVHIGGRLGVAPVLARLRAEEPLAYVQLPYGGPAWLVTRHEDAKIVVTDRRFSRAAAVRPDAPRLMPTQRNPDVITSIDPPDHTRVRKLASKAFTPARVRELRAQAEAVATELVDGLVAAGSPADLVTLFARPLPLSMICGMLGIAAEDRPRFREWADHMLLIGDEDAERSQLAMKSLFGHIVGLVERRRKGEGDDLLADLVAAADGSDQLTENELIYLATGLLAAGYETTSTMIANAVYLLFANPDQFAALRRDPGLVPSAVEEFLRYAGVTGVDQARLALADVELSGGTVRAGEMVIVSLQSANRDEAVFTDPDRLDLGRNPNSHLSFSHGPHFCIGAQLARMEVAVALRTLLDRLPGLAPGVPVADVRWVEDSLARRPVELPIIW